MSKGLCIVVVLIVIAFAGLQLCKNKPRKQVLYTVPVHQNEINIKEVWQNSREMNDSLNDLSTVPAPHVANNFPDIVGNIWKVEKSQPDGDNLDRAMTPWQADLINPAFNRYNIDTLNSVGGMAQATSPSRDVLRDFAF